MSTVTPSTAPLSMITAHSKFPGASAASRRSVAISSRRVVFSSASDPERNTLVTKEPIGRTTAATPSWRGPMTAPSPRPSVAIGPSRPPRASTVMATRLATSSPRTSRRVLRTRRYVVAMPPLPAARGDQDPLHRLELLEAPARSEHHAVQRILGYAHRHAGLMPQPLVEAAEHGAAPGQEDALVHQVGGELRRAPVQGVLDRVDHRVHRLLDDVRRPRTRGDRGLLHGSLLDTGDAARHAHDNTGLREEAPGVHLLDEVPEHLLGDVEVGDHAVLRGSPPLDVGGGAADHALGLGPHGEALFVPGFDAPPGRLVQDDALATDIHEGIGRAEIHGHIPSEEAGEAFGAIVAVVGLLGT